MTLTCPLNTSVPPSINGIIVDKSGFPFSSNSTKSWTFLLIYDLASMWSNPPIIMWNLLKKFFWKNLNSFTTGFNIYILIFSFNKFINNFCFKSSYIFLYKKNCLLRLDNSIVSWSTTKIILIPHDAKFFIISHPKPMHQQLIFEEMDNFF